MQPAAAAALFVCCGYICLLLLLLLQLVECVIDSKVSSHALYVFGVLQTTAGLAQGDSSSKEAELDSQPSGPLIHDPTVAFGSPVAYGSGIEASDAHTLAIATVMCTPSECLGPFILITL